MGAAAADTAQVAMATITTTTTTTTTMTTLDCVHTQATYLGHVPGRLYGCSKQSAGVGGGVCRAGLKHRRHLDAAVTFTWGEDGEVRGKSEEGYGSVKITNSNFCRL